VSERDAVPTPGSPAGHSDPPRLPHKQLALVLVGLMLGVLLAALDGTIVAVALPTISGDLGHVEDTHWVVTAYLMTATAATLLYGRTSDMLGRRPVFLSAVGLFLVGSALCAAAQGMGQLAAARAVQGIGGGGLLSLALAAVADLVPARKRAAYQGMFGAVYGLAGVLGPLIGGLIVDHASWRWLFLVNLPAGALVLLLVAGTLPATPRRAGHLDPFGAVLLAGAVGFFLCWTSRGQETGYTGAGTISLIVVAVLLAGTFVITQRTATSPVLPLRLFRSRGFAAVTVVAFCGGVSLFAAILFVPLFLQLVQHRSATTAGEMLAAMTGGLLVASMGVGRGVTRTGRPREPMLAGTVAIAVAIGLLTRLDPDSPAGATVAVLVLLGLGLGCVSPMLVTVAQSAVPRSDLGVATASVSFFRNLGATVGSAVGVAVLTHVLGDRAGRTQLDPTRLRLLPDHIAALPPTTRASFVDAFADAATRVFAFALPVAVLAVLAAALIPQAPRRAPTAAAEAASDVDEDALRS
jgi:EmrB/QacA subfamily drug resistance transporter